MRKQGDGPFDDSCTRLRHVSTAPVPPHPAHCHPSASVFGTDPPLCLQHGASPTCLNTVPYSYRTSNPASSNSLRPAAAVLNVRHRSPHFDDGLRPLATATASSVAALCLPLPCTGRTRRRSVPACRAPPLNVLAMFPALQQRATAIGCSCMCGTK